MKRITLAIVMTAAIVGGLAGAVVGVTLGRASSDSSQVLTTAGASPTGAVSTAPRTGLSPEDVYRRAAPAVVVITSTQTQEIPPTFFTPPRKERVGALGSGFVIDAKGDIVTNDHVVTGGSDVRVGFSSGASYPAKVIGADPSSDVAVVRVKAPAPALHPLTFDDSAAIAVGDPVYAIGNPFGLDQTMTAGIVSAVGRDIEAPNGLAIPNAIQTDAPVNHGNSGGPLLDRLGRVVGVNAQIEGGTVDGNVGIGFAIPSSTARWVAAQLIASGRAEHAWLGVEVETIDSIAAKVVRGLPARGVVIARVVKNSPAAKAGLVAASSRQVTVDGVSVPVGGDAIVAVDGNGVSTSQQLADLVAAHKPGDQLELDVVRTGKRRTVVVSLGDVPAGRS
jgi:S1-C subfamily serine protease